MSFSPETKISLQSLSLALEYAPRSMMLCEQSGAILVANALARGKCGVASGDNLIECCDTPVSQVSKALGDALQSSQPVHVKLQIGDVDQGFQFWRVDPLPGMLRPLVMIKIDAETSLAARLMRAHDLNARHVERLEAAEVEANYLKSQARRLRQLAETDRMTGLLNATVFEQRCRKRLRRDGCTGALVFIDLDNFKSVNDCFGHDAGDAVLRCIAGRLREASQEDDLAGRLGGDEFGVWFDQATPGALIDRLDHLEKTVSQPVPWTSEDGEATMLTVGLSLGVAAVPQDGQRYSRLRARADERMYARKPKPRRTQDKAG